VKERRWLEVTEHDDSEISARRSAGAEVASAYPADCWFSSVTADPNTVYFGGRRVSSSGTITFHFSTAAGELYRHCIWAAACPRIWTARVLVCSVRAPRPRGRAHATEREEVAPAPRRPRLAHP